jgi:protoporphyrinogen oxidase
VTRVAAESRFTYRGLILVFLGLNRPQISPDHWTYFPSADLLFGRSHEPKNWSAATVPGQAVTSLALEVFSSPGEPLWDSDDSMLVDRAIGELEAMTWIRRGDVLHSRVLRIRHAYPVHSIGYAQAVQKVRDVLARWPRMSLLGRTGSFSYMNVDGVVEQCFRLAAHLGLDRPGDVRPLTTDTGRWT